MLCPAAQPLAGFSSWGCSLKKAKFRRGPLRCGCLTLVHQYLAFPLSPCFSSHPRVSGWLCSGMAQLDVRRHRDAPTDAVPLCCLFALLIVRFSPALKTPERTTTQPLELRPRGRWQRDARQEPPLRQRRGSDSWARSPRRQDQLLGAQYAPVFLSSCCC